MEGRQTISNENKLLTFERCGSESHIQVCRCVRAHAHTLVSALLLCVSVQVLMTFPLCTGRVWLSAASHFLLLHPPCLPCVCVCAVHCVCVYSVHAGDLSKSVGAGVTTSVES